MYEVHPRQLWIGHANDVRTPQPLFERGIRAVVDVAYEEPPAALPRPLIYLRFPLLDGNGNDVELLRIGLQSVVGLLRAKIPSLIGCSAGMSRSPTFAAVAMSLYLDRPPDEILARIAAEKPVDVSAPLWETLQLVGRQMSAH